VTLTEGIIGGTEGLALGTAQGESDRGCAPTSGRRRILLENAGKERKRRYVSWTNVEPSEENVLMLYPAREAQAGRYLFEQNCGRVMGGKTQVLES